MTSTEQKILAIVEMEGIVSSRLIANKLGITPDYAKYLCKYLIKEGRLKYSRGGCFKLASKGQKKKVKEIKAKIVSVLSPPPLYTVIARAKSRSNLKTRFLATLGMARGVKLFMGQYTSSIRQKIFKEKIKIKDNFMKLFEEINKRWGKRWRRKKKKG